MKNALLILSLLALAGQQWALSWYQGETSTLRAEKSALQSEANILRAGLRPEKHDHKFRLLVNRENGGIMVTMDDTPVIIQLGVCKIGMDV